MNDLFGSVSPSQPSLNFPASLAERYRPQNGVQSSTSAPFVAVRQAVMRGSEWVANACSHTMAKRIARALNLHKPNREGV